MVIDPNGGEEENVAGQFEEAPPVLVSKVELGPSEESFERYELSKGRRWAYVGYGIFYALITLFSISDFSPSNTVGWLALPLLGVGSFHFLRAGLDPKPRFEFTPDGFIDRSFVGGGVVHLRWDEILGFEWTTFGGRLEILVRNPAEVRARAGWARRFWMVLGSLWRKKTISIIPFASGPNVVELKAQLEDRLFEFERNQVLLGMSEQSSPEPGLMESGEQGDIGGNKGIEAVEGSRDDG